MPVQATNTNTVHGVPRDAVTKRPLVPVVLPCSCCSCSDFRRLSSVTHSLRAWPQYSVLARSTNGPGSRLQLEMGLSRYGLYSIYKASTIHELLPHYTLIRPALSYSRLCVQWQQTLHQSTSTTHSLLHALLLVGRS